MTELSAERRLFEMERDIQDLKADQVETHKELQNLREERDRALKWGIMALGGLLISIFGWAASFLKDHIK